MKIQLVVLFVLALTAQLVNAAWHGFDPVEDGLQFASAGTLALPGPSAVPRGDGATQGPHPARPG